MTAPPPPPALSPERRAEIEARLAAAEAQPAGCWSGPNPQLLAFYEAAPTDLRALLDEVARLTEEVEMGRRRERSAGEAHGRVLAALRAENERLEREVVRLQDVAEALTGRRGRCEAAIHRREVSGLARPLVHPAERRGRPAGSGGLVAARVCRPLPARQHGDDGRSASRRCVFGRRPGDASAVRWDRLVAGLGRE